MAGPNPCVQGLGYGNPQEPLLNPSPFVTRLFFPPPRLPEMDGFSVGSLEARFGLSQPYPTLTWCGRLGRLPGSDPTRGEPWEESPMSPGGPGFAVGSVRSGTLDTCIRSLPCSPVE